MKHSLIRTLSRVKSRLTSTFQHSSLKCERSSRPKSLGVIQNYRASRIIKTYITRPSVFCTPITNCLQMPAKTNLTSQTSSATWAVKVRDHFMQTGWQSKIVRDLIKFLRASVTTLRRRATWFIQLKRLEQWWNITTWAEIRRSQFLYSSNAFWESLCTHCSDFIYKYSIYNWYMNK